MRKVPGRLKTLVGVAAIAILQAASSANAAVIYSETANGDLSGDRLNPTALALSASGTPSSVTATTTAGDLDYLSFTVPSGATLTALRLGDFVSDDDLGFMAIQAGSTFTEAASPFANVANLLGYTHFGTGQGGVGVDGDLLAGFAAGPGAIGFTPPLGPGTYTLWIQQTNPVSVAYQLDFFVVPEPGGVALIGLGLAGLSVAGRRRDRAPS